MHIVCVVHSLQLTCAGNKKRFKIFIKNTSYFECLEIQRQVLLTFKNPAPYIQDGRTATLQMLRYIYIFSANISTEYFKHAAHSPFFSSKCRLFHNATFFWFLYYSHFTKNPASYIQDGRTATLEMLHFIYNFYNKYKY